VVIVLNGDEEMVVSGEVVTLGEVVVPGEAAVLGEVVAPGEAVVLGESDGETAVLGDGAFASDGEVVVSPCAVTTPSSGDGEVEVLEVDDLPRMGLSLVTVAASPREYLS